MSTEPSILPNGLIERRPPSPLPVGPATLADVLVDGVANHPDRLALIDGDRTWTYGELDAAVADQARTSDTSGGSMWFESSGADLIIAILAAFRVGSLWFASSRKPDSLAFSGETSPVARNSPAAVAFTSGTTGEPKKVVHTHQAMLLPAALSTELEPPEPGERIGTPLDLAIANVFVLGPLSAFVRGSTFVVMDRKYASGLAEDIETHRVTRLFLVSALAHDLVVDETVSSGQLASLDRVILGGSGASPETRKGFRTKFGLRPTLSYGLSEAPTGVVRESVDDPIGSGRGFPLPHIEVDIVNPDGSQCPVGTEGEICLRPARKGAWANTWTGTLGYLGRPEATSDLFRDGLLHTGDLGKLDGDGAVSVTGRLSDVIIRGGQNIDPTNIEGQLRTIDWIEDALAVGLPDDRLGQRVGVLLVTSGAADNSELAAVLSETTGHPIDEIAVVDSLPRNEMGKLIRSAAMDTFRQGDIVDT